MSKPIYLLFDIKGNKGIDGYYSEVEAHQAARDLLKPGDEYTITCTKGGTVVRGRVPK